MFDQGYFKLKVIVQGQTYGEQISSPICIS